MRAILTYHSIDTSGSPVSVDPDVFRRQVEWLGSGEVPVVPLRELVDARDGDAIAVTFDDGLASFGEIAAPLLLERGLPVTLFALPDMAGRTNRFGNAGDRGIPEMPLLDTAALAELAAAGVDLGAHTRTHPDLSTLPDDRIEEEVGGSAASIEAVTGRRPTAFAYPYGRFDERSRGAVAETFDLACSTRFGLVDASSDRHALPRIDMYYLRQPGSLEAWGTPAFERRVAAIRLRRGARRTLQALGAVR